MRFERSTRVYRRLLRALPAHFRERYADELVEIFRGHLEAAVRRWGRTGIVFAWSRALVDLTVQQLPEAFRKREASVSFNSRAHRNGVLVPRSGGGLREFVGLYGVISYSVRERAFEIGVRMAFGADDRRILRNVLAQGMRLTLIGVAVGVVGAHVLTQILSTMLVGVTATDPATFAVISLSLTAVAFVACYAPARRATRVDPLRTLRAD